MPVRHPVEAARTIPENDFGDVPRPLSDIEASYKRSQS
jgi:hypothetical protein